MPNYRYRALAPNGEIINGSLTASNVAEVNHRIEYLGLLPVEAVIAERSSAGSGMSLALFNKPRASDVTIFSRDLALLLNAGARLDDALDLLANDADIGRLRPYVSKIRAAVLAGESFAESLEKHPTLFPPMYVALVRVGEVSGALNHILEMLSNERARAEATQRKITDALQYPAFVLLAACGVLVFFGMFVLPQFSAVLRDFGAKTNSAITTFLDLSDFLHEYGLEVVVALAVVAIASWVFLRRPGVIPAIINEISRLPFVSVVFDYYRSALFCRNLGILLGSGVTLTAALRILVDIMGVTGKASTWIAASDRVRHGGKLSDALAAAAILPAMAIRMLRLGEETGQLSQLSGRVADFYEAKLQRSLDRIVGIIGPLAIVTISLVVGGLIVSVMTALLSVSQIAA